MMRPYPTVSEAERLLREAEACNPGPWGNHSRVAALCAKRIAAAAGMDAGTLKRQFGERVVFWGGAYDPQMIDRTADYETVRRAVYENVKTMGEGGGYLFSGVHNLPGDVTETHLAAMLDAWKDARSY